MEVKPTRELEQEIERFGMAKIKWHTPFDYSLDKQVVRYDFLGSDLPRELYIEKSESFDRSLFKYHQRKYPNEAMQFSEDMKPVGRPWPHVKEVNGSSYCVIEVNSAQGHFPRLVQLGQGVSISLINSEDGHGLYDVSAAYKSNQRVIYQNECLPETIDRKTARIQEFLEVYILLPHLNKDVKLITAGRHKHPDFSLRHLFGTIGGL